MVVSATANTPLLPTPRAAVSSLVRLFSSLNLLFDIGATIARMLAGFSLAVLAGVGLGFVVGMSERAYRITAPLFDFLRSVPVTTLYPVFVLALGVGNISKVAMVFWGSFFIVFVNAADGVRSRGAAREEMARVFGATRGQVLRHIVWFESLPRTMTGVRLGISYALIVEILCEMFMGSNRGLGQRVIEAYTAYAIADLAALVLITGCVGYAVNAALRSAEAHIDSLVHA